MTMKKRASLLRGRVSSSTQVGAAEFKARCLELMNHVRDAGVEYVVTKHGQPVAKLVPFSEPSRAAFFGSLKGSVLRFDRPLDPLEDEYDIDRSD
jgi:prevent-host-death family protein